MVKYFRLIQFLKYTKKETNGKILLGLAIVLSSFLQAYCLAKGVTAVFEQAETRKIFCYFLLALLFLVFRALMVRYQEGYVKQFSAKIKGIIRSRMLEKLMNLGPAYKNDHRSGSLQSLITDGVESFEPFLTQYLPQTAIVFITTLATTTFMWMLDPVVGVMVFLMALIAIVIPHLFMPAVSKAMIAYWQDYADLNAQYIDGMQGMNTLKSLGVSGREGKRLEKEAWQFAKWSMDNLAISLSDSAVITACTTIGTAFSVLIGAYHMAQGKITFEALLLILFLAGECMKPLNEMNAYWHSSYLGLSVAEELYQIMDEPFKQKKGDASVVLQHELPDIRMKKVQFAYAQDGPAVLQNVDMQIEAGKMTAIVGKSGSGKSTMVNLLLRFYDVSGGEILVDGQNIEAYTEDYIHSKAAVVFQETYLFYGTILENIRMARPEASLEEVIQAAKIANAHAFITELPQGYDTLVGERGATLSGGERQRIAIARAVLKDAPILILDEATSSVDVQNEQEIQEALEKAMKNRTTIVIAHRLSTIEKADRIYVLKDGRIVGNGTHKELLNNNEVYQTLIKAQNYEE